MASARRELSWEELLLDRTWPAALFALMLCAKLLRLGETIIASRSGSGPVGFALIADIGHQIGTVALLGLVVTLFIIRRAPVGKRSGPTGAIVALGGTLALSFLGVADTIHAFIGVESLRPSDNSIVLGVSAILVAIGSVLTVVALATLGRCFGLFPEARGLVTRGVYRFVRHPVYLGEYISGLGVFIPIFSPGTAVVFAAFVALQLWRIFNEERALEAAFPAYASYRERTWRLVPGVF